MENLPRNQKEYYHNKIREYEKRTGKSMNVKGVSKFYDYNIENAVYNTPAALEMMEKQKCYIYYDALVEEDPRSNGTHWAKYGFACVNGKTYKYYYETKNWGQQIKNIDVEQCKDIRWKAAKLDIYNFPYLDPGEDYLPYAIENKHIGSSFDDFAKEQKIELKRDMNWAIKMLGHGKIVYREEFPEVILFPIGAKNNAETKLTVDDLFAEDWMVFRGKNLKEVLDDFYAGKTIRRKSWYPEYGLGKYSKDVELNLEDIRAFDWEVVDVVSEVDQIQKQHLKDRNEH